MNAAACYVGDGTLQATYGWVCVRSSLSPRGVPKVSPDVLASVTLTTMRPWASGSSLHPSGHVADRKYVANPPTNPLTSDALVAPCGAAGWSTMALATCTSMSTTTTLVIQTTGRAARTAMVADRMAVAGYPTEGAWRCAAQLAQQRRLTKDKKLQIHAPQPHRSVERRGHTGTVAVSAECGAISGTSADQRSEPSP